MPKVTAWMAREASRFVTGKYCTVPWTQESWWNNRGDFVHLSTKQPGMLAYTSNPTKGDADIQTPIKPAKYLAKFYAETLTKSQIAAYANQIQNTTSTTTKATPTTPQSELHICTSRQECIHAYTNGPQSCMSYPQGKYAGSAHPASIFGDDSDLTIATIRQSNRITARTICNPTRNIFYNSGYGDMQTLRNQLTSAGWQPGNFIGDTIPAIPSFGERRFVATSLECNPFGKLLQDQKRIRLISLEEFHTLAPSEKISFGYYGGVTA